MDQLVFSAFLTQIAGQTRYEDQGDGTAVDTWFRDFNELIRGAERDTAAEVRESSAVVADNMPNAKANAIAVEIRKLRYEPE